MAKKKRTSRQSNLLDPETIRANLELLSEEQREHIIDTLKQMQSDYATIVADCFPPKPFTAGADVREGMFVVLGPDGKIYPMGHPKASLNSVLNSTGE